MATPDLATFGAVLDALRTEAMRCLQATENAVAVKAWRRVVANLDEAVLAATDACPICGEVGEVYPCPWCGLEACRGQCQQDAHGGARECPHKPQPVEPAYDEPEEDDITW